MGRARRTIERLGLATATTLIGINLWTGFPLLAIWVGSRVVGSTGLSIGAVFLVFVILAATTIAGVVALTRMSARYDRITGRAPATRQVAPWLRSMRAERVQTVRRGRRLNALERIVVASVVAAVVAFEVWFFFFAGSSLPNGG